MCIGCDYLLNAGGPHAADIAEMAGIGCREHSNLIMRAALPVRPRKRYVFVFHCPQGPTSENLLVADCSGVYFRREGPVGSTTFICGRSPSQVTHAVLFMG